MLDNENFRAKFGQSAKYLILEKFRLYGILVLLWHDQTDICFIHNYSVSRENDIRSIQMREKLSQ